jgi:hypothetical protein
MGGIVTKASFERAIDNISHELWGRGYFNYTTGEWDYFGWFLCPTIEHHIGEAATDEFKSMLKGAKDDMQYGMFGQVVEFENQELRFQALYLFEQWCLDNKTYLNW